MTEISLKSDKKSEQSKVFRITKLWLNLYLYIIFTLNFFTLVEFVFVYNLLYHLLSKINYASNILQKKKEYSIIEEAVTVLETVKTNLNNFRSQRF